MLTKPNAPHGAAPAPQPLAVGAVDAVSSIGHPSASTSVSGGVSAGRTVNWKAAAPPVVSSSVGRVGSRGSPVSPSSACPISFLTAAVTTRVTRSIMIPQPEKATVAVSVRVFSGETVSPLTVLGTPGRDAGRYLPPVADPDTLVILVSRRRQAGSPRPTNKVPVARNDDVE